MSRIRDFIYNISDVLVTLLIIAIAMLFIAWRVSAIMDYPERIAGVSEDSYISENADTAEDSAHSGDGSADDAVNGDDNSASSSDGDKIRTYAVTVTANESAGEIAQSLVDAGILSTTKEFLDAVSAAGAESRLKMGTFNISSDATASEIVVMMTA